MNRTKVTWSRVVLAQALLALAILTGQLCFGQECFRDPVSGIEVRRIILKEDTLMQVYARSTFPVLRFKAGEVWVSRDTRYSASGRLVVRGTLAEAGKLTDSNGREIVVPAGTTIHIKGTDPGMGAVVKMTPGGSRANGAAQAKKPGVSTATKPGVSSAKKTGVSQAAKPGVSTAQKPGVSTAQKPGVSDGSMTREFEFDDGSVDIYRVRPGYDGASLADADVYGALDVAKASRRMLMGRLSLDDERRYGSEWNPHFQHPNEESDSHFRSLSALSSETLSIRTGIAQAAREYDGALSQAALSKVLGDEAGYEKAMSHAGAQRKIARSARRRLEAVAGEMEKMGPAPDPKRAQARAREKHEAALKTAVALTGVSAGRAAAPAAAKRTVNTGAICGSAHPTDGSHYYDYRSTKDFECRRCGLVITSEADYCQFVRNHYAAFMACGGDRARDHAVSLPSKQRGEGIYFTCRLCGKEIERGLFPDQYIYILLGRGGSPPSAQAPPSPGPVPSWVLAQSDAEDRAQAIRECRDGIEHARKVKAALEQERAQTGDEKTRKAVDFLILQQESNIHHLQELIASKETGSYVHTPGPFEEYAAALFQKSVENEVKDFTRLQRIQESAAQMAQSLRAVRSEDAETVRRMVLQELGPQLYATRDVAKAQAVLDRISAIVQSNRERVQAGMTAQAKAAQEQLAEAKTMDTALKVAEATKTACTVALGALSFWASFAAAPAEVAAMALTSTETAAMAAAGTYDVVVGYTEEGVKGSVKALLMQTAAMGIAKAGAWGVQAYQIHRYEKEVVAAKGMVQELGRRQQALKAAMRSGASADEVARLESSVTELVCDVNGSWVAKKALKTEIQATEKACQAAGEKGAEARKRLEELQAVEAAFTSQLEGIYRKVDDAFIRELQALGYNVDGSMFQEFRNALSKGINMDRDKGVVRLYEAYISKHGSDVPLDKVMEEFQRVYNKAYEAVTRRSAQAADQNITTSVFNEAFPLRFLSPKMVGTVEDPAAFRKAGDAIVSKVENAFKGAESAIVQERKAASSLAKDLKTKLIQRLRTQKPQPGAGDLTLESMDATARHYEKVAGVYDDFASGRIDYTAYLLKMRKITGGQGPREVARRAAEILTRLGAGR